MTFALAELLVAGGERVGIPGLMNPTASRTVIDKMAQAMLHDDATRAEPAAVVRAVGAGRNRGAVGFLVADRRDQDHARRIVGIRRARHAGADRRSGRRKLSLFRARSNSSNPKAAASSPRAAPKAGPTITSRASRCIATRSAAETNKLDWLFSTHTTSRSAAELLLFLHSGMMVSKGSARTATVKAGRSA